MIPPRNVRKAVTKDKTKNHETVTGPQPSEPHGVDWPEKEAYRGSMSKEQLTAAVMALPLAERVSLAQELWQSIEGTSLSSARDEEHEALAEAHRRDAELSSGAVAGRTHEQVMETMRRSILYRIEGEEVRILVVKHHGRHPDYWKGRLPG